MTRKVPPVILTAFYGSLDCKMKPIGNVTTDSKLEGFDGLFNQVKAEVNFLRLPYFATCKSAQNRLIELKETVDRDGVKRKIEWRVIPDPTLGLPGLLERNVMLHILKQADKLRQSPNAPIPEWFDIGSIYSICEELELNKGGENFRRIKLAIEKLGSTNCISKGAFYNKAQHSYVESGEVFTFLCRWGFKGELHEGALLESNYVSLHPYVRQNLDAFYVKSIDWALLRSFDCEIAALLYPHLSCVFHGLRKEQEYIELAYPWLAQRLGIKVWDELKEAKKQLKPVHKELVDKCYLAKAEWFEDRIRYYPGFRALSEIVSQKKKKRAAIVKRPKATQLVIPELVPLTQEIDVRQGEIARQAARVNLGKPIALDRLAMFEITEDEVLTFAASQKVTV